MISSAQMIDIIRRARERMPLKADIPVRAAVSPVVWDKLKNLPTSIKPTAQRGLSHVAMVGLPVRIDDELCDGQYEILYADGHTERHDLHGRR